MNKPGISKWESFLAKEIGIEFKACLYFYCILFYYCIYRLTLGSFHADILSMAEMILTTYLMGYLQVYMLSDFDESDTLHAKGWISLIFCSLLYTGVAYLGRWFCLDTAAYVAFFFYMVFAYFCAFLVYKLKRIIDEKHLNQDLKAFQERRMNDEKDN